MEAQIMTSSPPVLAIETRTTPRPEGAAGGDPALIELKSFSFWYGAKQALFDIDLKVKERSVTAFIGPSGCGKSTLLRCLNRMNDLIDGVRVEGSARVNGEDLYGPDVDVVDVRKRLGMVFQKSNPFPKSIFENVVYGLRIQGEKNRARLSQACEVALEGAALWDEVKDRLEDSALSLSGGQMQRLCIARALAVDTAKIEELIFSLKERFTIVIVTHNMQQAARVSDETGFFMLGKLVEFDKTDAIFTRPRQKMTETLEPRSAQAT